MMSQNLCDNIYDCYISEQLYQWMSVGSLGSKNVAYSFSELTQNNYFFYKPTANGFITCNILNVSYKSEIA